MPDACENLVTGGELCRFYVNVSGQGPQCGQPSDAIFWAGCIHEHVRGELMCSVHTAKIEKELSRFLVCGICDTIAYGVVAGHQFGPHKCRLLLRVELDVDWQRALRSAGPGGDTGVDSGSRAVQGPSGQYR